MRPPPVILHSRLGPRCQELFHPRLHTVLRALLAIQVEDAWIFVLVLDLVAAIGGRLVHVLVARLAALEDLVAHPTEAQRQIAGRAVGGVEVLVIGGTVRRRVECARLPVHSDRVDRTLALAPQQRVSTAGYAED